MGVTKAQPYLEWQRFQADHGRPNDPMETCLQCQDTVESVLLRACSGREQQMCVVRLFLVSKLWREAAKGLDIWRLLAWETASRGAQRNDQAVPALKLSIERWWGERITELDAGSGEVPPLVLAYH